MIETNWISNWKKKNLIQLILDARFEYDKFIMNNIKFLYILKLLESNTWWTQTWESIREFQSQIITKYKYK